VATYIGRVTAADHSVALGVMVQSMTAPTVTSEYLPSRGEAIANAQTAPRLSGDFWLIVAVAGAGMAINIVLWVVCAVRRRRRGGERRYIQHGEKFVRSEPL
jgi:hypothetical protein